MVGTAAARARTDAPSSVTCAPGNLHSPVSYARSSAEGKGRSHGRCTKQSYGRTLACRHGGLQWVPCRAAGHLAPRHKQ